MLCGWIAFCLLLLAPLAVVLMALATRGLNHPDGKKADESERQAYRRLCISGMILIHAIFVTLALREVCSQ